MEGDRRAGAHDSGTARPTVIYNSGYDSTLEEAYFAVGAAALSRGYNVLAFDGPGQGAALRVQGLVFRPDWEKVVSKDHSLAGVAQRVTAPTLILDAEHDQFFKGQPQLVERALTQAATTLVTLTAAEGAGEHCHMGALTRAHQVMFDWLDGVLAHTPMQSTTGRSA